MGKRSYESDNQYKNENKKRKKEVSSIDNENLRKEDAKVRRQEKIKDRKRKLERTKELSYKR